LALQEARGDGAFDEIAADDDEGDAALGECGDHGAEGVFAGTLALGDGLVAFVDGLGRGEVREVAGDEDDAAAGGHEGEGCVDEVHLRVQIQVHGVVGGLVFLEPAAGVEDEYVEVGPGGADVVEGGGDFGGAGDVGLEEEGAAAEGFDGGGNFLGARAFAAEVDGDVCTDGGELASYAGADAAGGSGDERCLAEQRGGGGGRMLR